MKLRSLLAQMQVFSEDANSKQLTSNHPAFDMEVTGLSTNSHTCQPGDLFLGMPGTRVDGGEFWPSAMTAGAVAALISPLAFEKTQQTSGHSSTCLLQCTDMARACAEASTAFFNFPSTKLKLVGVTGTNGKTTTTHIIEWLLNASGNKTALFGTLYARWPGYIKTAQHTTPFAVELHEQLSLAVEDQCAFGVMEVSSHALAQKRVLGCSFEVSAFTNLTQDHLDFHDTVEDYFAAKALLFEPNYLRGRAIVNLDDSYGQRLLQSLKERTSRKPHMWSYSATGNANADIYPTELIYQADGVTGVLNTPLGTRAFSSPLVGQFNLANLLAAVGAVLSLGISLDDVIAAIPQFSGVPGRMERIQISPDQDISVIVDYAHTPDGLENLLDAARPFIAGKMICVFGCGGDRDRTKRPKMGSISARLADYSIVTSDNPRTEDPHRILDDVVKGIPEGTNYQIVSDRAEAIKTAILNVKSGDGVLIAGKGHEDYQILGTEKIHFDDREQAQQALRLRYAR